MHAPPTGPITAPVIPPVPAQSAGPTPYRVSVASLPTRPTTRLRTGRTHRFRAVVVIKALAAIMLAAIVLVAMALVASCTTSPPPTSPHIPLPQPADTGQSTARTPPQSHLETTPPVDMPRVDTPQAVAIQWLSAYRSATWTHPDPAAWVDRVQPYVTDSMHARNTTLRDGGTGTDWTDFVSQRCRSSVSEVAAVVPAEAPGNSDAANVLVTGTVTTTCAEGTDSSIEQVSATLVGVKASNGWRVDERLF